MTTPDTNLYKLPFKIIYCSSQDDEYPCTELQSHNSKTKGWQSKRLCSYPQTLIIDLGMDMDVHKLQVLSHQSKIASIIEIFVARANEIQSFDFKSSQMLRLGYLSLDSNVKTNFKARELKTVFVNSVCRYIRLTVQDFHRNQLNLFHQVGFVALNIVGSPVSDGGGPIQDHSAALNTSAVSATLSSPTIAPVLGGHTTVSQFKAGECVICADENGRVWLATEPAPGCYAVPVPPMPSAALSDEEARRQLRGALTAKLAAALAEDYLEAARMKAVCDALLDSAEVLRALAEQKALCIAREDYDGAQRCKLEIEAIRTSLTTGGTSVPHSPHPSCAPLHVGPSPSPSLSPSLPARSRAQPPLASRERPAPAVSAFGAVPKSATAHTDCGTVAGYFASGAAASVYTDARGSRGYPPVSPPVDSETAGVPGAATTSAASEDAHAGVDAHAYANVGSRGWRTDGHASTDERLIYAADERPLKGAVAHTAIAIAAGAEPSLPVRRGSWASPQDERPLQGASGGMSAASAVGVVSGVDGDEAETALGLGGPAHVACDGPEPLSLAAAKDAEPLLPVLGEHVVRCTFSKQWALRQASCRAIAHAALGAPPESPQAAISTDSAIALMAAASKVVRRALADSAVVALAAVDTLLASVAGLTAGADVSLYSPAQAWPCAPSPVAQPVPPAQASALLEPLLQPLLALLGAANARLRTVASEAFLALVSGEGVPRGPLIHALCRPLSKRDAGKPLAIRHRCQLVAAVHTLLQRDAQTAALITLGSVAPLATAGLAHRDGAVRETTAHMLAVVAGASGMKAVRATFKSLSAAQLELVAKEHEKLSLGAPALPGAATSPPRIASSASTNTSPEPAAAAPARAAKATKSAKSAVTALAPNQPDQPDRHQSRHQAHGGDKELAGRSSESRATAGEAGEEGSGGGTAAAATTTGLGGGREPTDVSAAASASGSALHTLMTASPPLLGTEPLFGALAVDHDDPHCCQFCGHCDPSLADEAAQDLHFWQSCPMLCQCPLCEQIIEVATLHSHLHGECEVDFSQGHALAYRSALMEGIHGTLELVSNALAQGPMSELYRRMLTHGHTLSAGLSAADICPLCFVAVGAHDRAWRIHLLAHPCKNNTRITSLARA